MTRAEVLQSVSEMTKEQEEQWMFALGAYLTIAARDSYVPGQLAGDAVQLMGFNELQHQVYGRLRNLRENTEWTPESFLDTLIAKSRVYNIEGGLGFSIQRSLRQALDTSSEKALVGERRRVLGENLDV